MKWTTLTLTALLPFALFAKEIDISSTSETLIENGQENAAKEIIAVEDSSQKWKATDSLNLKDAGNSPVISNEVASINSLSDSLTDSPKTDSLALINDMKAGLTEEELKSTLVIEDRAAAIQTACTLAQAGDVILVAGKGHEDYQIIKGVKHHFDDHEQVRKYI